MGVSGEGGASSGRPVFATAEEIFDRGRTPDDPGLAISHTLEYVSIAGDSTGRARSVLLLLITLSVGAFAAFWSVDHTLVQRRIGTIEAALTAGHLGWGDDCTKRAGLRCGQLARVWRASRESVGKIGDSLAGPDTVRKVMEATLAELRKGKGGEERTMTLPVLGVEFEATDLWLFSGLGFVLLLIVLGYCIASEQRDVRMAFRTAERLGTTRMCHRLLAMRQVLTVPDRTTMPFAGAWDRIAGALYFIPLFVQGYSSYVVISGRQQFVGGVPRVTWGGWVLQSVLFLATLILTAVVYKLATEYRAEWTERTTRLLDLTEGQQ
jgi:hypothetical protein